MKTRGKNRNPKEAVYGALLEIDFDTVTIAASQANTTVQARFPLGLDFKCLRVALVPNGAIAGLTSFNVVQGAAAEGGVGPDDQSDFSGTTPGVYAKATSGAQMFSVDQAVTNTADLVQIFTPTNPEVIYPQGSELTLRYVSTAGGAGTVKVVLYGKFVDTQPTKPMSANPAHTFNPATDL